MNANANEVIEFFKGIYAEESQLDEQKKSIREDLKAYATKIETSSRALLQSYALFKKYASGKSTADETSDYNDLSNVIIDYFESV